MRATSYQKVYYNRNRIEINQHTMSQNKSIIGRAVEKSGIKVDENGATVAGSSNASSRRASEDLVKESKTLLRNRAGESKSPYVCPQLAGLRQDS